MVCRKVSWLLVVAAGLVIGSQNVSATSQLITKVQTHLYAGQTAEAVAVVERRLAEAPDDAQARFTLGAVQFMQAVEHLGQALHRYGLRKAAGGNLYSGLVALPILRIPVPDNPKPDRLTYEAFRGVLKAFVRELEVAEATLSRIKDGAIDLPLNIGLIRLDLNGDGKASGEEALWHLFKVVAEASWLNEADASELLTNFDGSDVPWLRAYCHLLQAIAEFPLAHDWRLAFETTFHSVFPKAGLPFGAFAGKDAEDLAELERLKRTTPPDDSSAEDRKAWYEGYGKRIYELRERVEGGAIAELVAFIHLIHWPVVEPKRMKSVLEHLGMMVRLSRESWRRILAETDNNKEWIPNPRQSGVLPRMDVTEERVTGWQRFLDEFEAILQGKKLIPHWRFDQGINLRRLFLEPRTFDIVLLLQGSAAVPYLEDGDVTSERTWAQITDVFGGNFFRYFIWFN